MKFSILGGWKQKEAIMVTIQSLQPLPEFKAPKVRETL